MKKSLAFELVDCFSILYRVLGRKVNNLLLRQMHHYAILHLSLAILFISEFLQGDWLMVVVLSCVVVKAAWQAGRESERIRRQNLNYRENAMTDVTKAFRDWKFEEVQRTFGLNRSFQHPLLEELLRASHEPSPSHRATLEELRQELFRTICGFIVRWKRSGEEWPLPGLLRARK